MHICVGKMRSLPRNEVFDAFLLNNGFRKVLNSNSKALRAKAMTKRIATRCGALLALV